jgi:hypothetical protein
LRSFASIDNCLNNLTDFRVEPIENIRRISLAHETIDMSVAENRWRHGLKGGLYIKGENLFAGPPPSEEQIRSKIKQELRLIP